MKTNKSRKLTRNSFKRKVIVFGVAVFMSVAMVATGFAAWIISSNTQADAEVGVNVATVSNATLGLTLDGSLFEQDDSTKKYTHKNTFVFGPAAGDTKGKVKNSSTAPADETENLVIEISGTVENIAQLGKLSMTIDFGAKLQAAHGDGYIVLPAAEIVFFDLVGDTETAGATYTVRDDDETKADFSYTIVIAWGEKFAGVNPGYYYDGIKADGSALTDSDLTGALADSVADLNALTATQIESQIMAFRSLLTSDLNSYTTDTPVNIVVLAEVA